MQRDCGLDPVSDSAVEWWPVFAGKSASGAGETAAKPQATSAAEGEPGEGEDDEEDYGDGTILDFSPHYSYVCGLRRVHCCQALLEIFDLPYPEVLTLRSLRQTMPC